MVEVRRRRQTSGAGSSRQAAAELRACANLVAASARRGQAVEARRLLAEFRAKARASAYAAAMGACVRTGRWTEALRLLEDCRRGTEPDVVAYTSAIAACTRSRQWEHATRLLVEMRARRPPSLERLPFSCQGDLAQMFRQIDGKAAPDMIARNATVIACAKGQLWSEALRRLGEMQSKRLVPGDNAWAATVNACDVAGLSELSRELRRRQAIERATRARLRPEEFDLTCDTEVKPVQRGAEWQRALQMLAVLRQQSAKLDSGSQHMRRQVGEVLTTFEKATKSPGGRPLGASQTSEGARAAILDLQRRTSSRPGPAAPMNKAIAADPRLKALLRGDMPRQRREAPPGGSNTAEDYAAAAAAAAAMANAAVAAVTERVQGVPAATEASVPAAPTAHFGPRQPTSSAAAGPAFNSSCSGTLPIPQAESTALTLLSASSVVPPPPFTIAPAAAPLARMPSAGSLFTTGGSAQARVLSAGPGPLVTQLGLAAPRKVSSPLAPAMHPMVSAGTTLTTSMPGTTGTALPPSAARPNTSVGPPEQRPSYSALAALGVTSRLMPAPDLRPLRPVSFPAFPPAPLVPSAPCQRIAP